MDSDEVRRIRQQLGVTQGKLARALGVSRALVGRWEAGTEKPSSMAANFLNLLLELRRVVKALDERAVDHPSRRASGREPRPE
jgi:DNA-binding transcriptional regulator YiaG